MMFVMDGEQIRWPVGRTPDESGVFVTNRISINATPEKVWSWLTYAQTWPEWYANSSNVVLPDDAEGRLKDKMTFRWRTFGVNLVSNVFEFVPNERLAWDGKSFGVDAYHAWRIIPTETGCDVLTEETQHGFLARLGNLFMPRRMSEQHQKWLEGLKAKAEG